MEVDQIEEFHGNERFGPPKYLDREGNTLKRVARGIIQTHAGLDAKIIETPKPKNQ